MTVSFRLIGVLLTLLQIGCAGKLTEGDNGTSVWTSESHAVSITFSAPRKLVYPQQDRPVDISIGFQTPNQSEEQILISAKDGIDHSTLNTILSGLKILDIGNVFLTVVDSDESLYAPRTTGDRLIGVKLSEDKAEVYVTEAMPYAVTANLCDVLSKTGHYKSIVLKSTQGLAKQFRSEQNAKYPKTA